MTKIRREECDGNVLESSEGRMYKVNLDVRGDRGRGDLRWN